MKRLFNITAVAVAVVLTLGGCTGNIFTSMDPPPDPPSDEDMLTSATDDLAGFLNEVDIMLEDGTLSGTSALAAADALASTYTDDSGAFTVAPTSATADQQQAAAIAGTIRVLSNDDTTELVGNFASLVGDLLVGGDSGTIEITPEDALATLFENTAADEASFVVMLDIFSSAASDFTFFADTDPATQDPGLESGEAGDVAQMAVLSIVVDSARTILEDGGTRTPAEADAALYDIVQGDTTIEDYVVGGSNPLDELTTTGSTLNNILTYAGIEI